FLSRPDPFRAYFVLRFSNGTQEPILNPANMTQEMIRGYQEMQDKPGALVDTKSLQVEDFWRFCLVKPPQLSLLASVSKDQSKPGTQNGNRQAAWAWLATVLKDGHPVCEGSRIAERWVLSTRSCVAPSNFSEYSVRLGSQMPASSLDGLYSVSKLILRSSDAQEDIALIQLAKPVPITPSLYPICLPDRLHIAPPGTNCLALTSAGRGAVEQNVLQWTVTSLTSCLPASASALTCAETSDLKGNYQMTAGGSFACLGENDQLYLEGIVPFSAGHPSNSYGKSNMQSAVFLQVAPLVPWIESQLHP
ncbi:hypothetical protein lerEdw1_004734, partial [Lerista edwardsae]